MLSPKNELKKMKNRSYRLLAVAGLMVAVHSQAATTLRTTSSGSSADKVSLDFSMGLSNSFGGFGGAFLAGVSFPVSRTVPIRIGGQTGLMVTPGVSLPLLVTASYSLSEKRSSMTPYVAASLGPVIGLSSGLGDLSYLGSYARYGGYYGWGGGLALAILMRPGLNFQLAPKVTMNTELAFGGLSGMFYISPTVGVSVAL